MRWNCTCKYLLIVLNMSSRTLKNISLSDRISDLLTTKPHDIDDDEDTNAKLTENTEDFSDDEVKETSAFRKRNAVLLEDIDDRYAGKKSSRKKLGIADTDNVSGSTKSEDSNLESKDLDDNDEIDSTSESETDVSVQESGSEVDEEEGESDGSEDQDVEFQHIDESKTKDSNKSKGQCVRNQLLIWENLLEMRIQFQKCLIAANKMPQDNKFTVLTENKSEFSKRVAETNKSIFGALHKLLELQNAVAIRFPETKHIYKTNIGAKVSNLPDEGTHVESEEIPSDTDPECESETEGDASPVKKQKLDLGGELNKRHNQYTVYRNSVIQKWNDKTRLLVSKNSINNHSVINQIEHNLSDKSRLIRKTQLKRSQYSIIGESRKEMDDIKKDEEISGRVAEEYSNNIFDDDDFYHHLLRELIEVKSADLTDPVQLGRQWIQLQNLRSKMKKKIDTRATKGRKIRYAVHTKLVNFMTSIDNCMWTNEAKNELYSSLFGKKK